MCNFKSKLSALLLTLMLVTLLPLTTQADHAQQTDEPLYVALIWHQHQPVYLKDPETNVYERPWVRVHSAKSYVDMVTMLDEHPEIRVTFNLTPSLLRQIEDFMNGAKDRYWVLAEIPAAELSEADKDFILRRFFDINPLIISRFPRYQELATLRGGASDEQISAAITSWTEADFRDLQVLFNLAWTDPDWLAQEPLQSLVAKGRDFAEEDKPIIFAEHLRLIEQVIPVHRAAQERGQIEITMTPFAHPILPLLVDSNVAGVAMPEAPLPTRFSYGQDAVAQVQLGVEFYERHFGLAPRGMWPAEGSVSQQIVQMVATAGIEWIATDEAVLARSLPDLADFTRDAQATVLQADALYQPYKVRGRRGGEVAIIFRDKIISDLIGFEYSAASGMTGQEAADDLMGRLNNIQAQLQAEGATGPNLVTILLDGENAWEYYENDGKDFLHAMYRELAAAPHIVTVTLAEFLAEHGDDLPLIEELWPGSWIAPDFATWIGEDEENLGWEYLKRMRDDVESQIRAGNIPDDLLPELMELVYIAQGSDWFWWYGDDQNSGNDDAFDAQFRGFLAQIYQMMGVAVPNYVTVPIVPQSPAPAAIPLSDLVNVSVDGLVSDEEWAGAAQYISASDALNAAYYGFDAENFYIWLDAANDLSSQALTFDLYLRSSDAGEATANPLTFEDVSLGFGARRLLRIETGTNPSARLWLPDEAGLWRETETRFDNLAINAGILELGLPLADLAPALRSGDNLSLRLIVSQADDLLSIEPTTGPALLTVPDQGVPNIVLAVTDPSEDDYGPGSYVYPLDGVFRTGAYDATGFVVGGDEEEIIFQVSLRGPLVNDWGAPNGMGILTLDIYIDTDGGASGSRLLLPGRNAALNSDHAWDYAIFAEGWYPAIYSAGDEGPAVLSNSALRIISNPGQRSVTIRVPRSILSGDESTWAYAVVVAGQEGFPSAGVLRIRDISPQAQQWRFGGGQGVRSETRIIDFVWPEGGVQEAALSNFTPTDDLNSLTIDDYPQLPMLRVE